MDGGPQLSHRSHVWRRQGAHREECIWQAASLWSGRHYNGFDLFVLRTAKIWFCWARKIVLSKQFKVKQLKYCIVRWEPEGHYCIMLLLYKVYGDSALLVLSKTSVRDISSYTPARRLRSLSQSLAVQPKVASKTNGERSFSFICPFLWHSLPARMLTLPHVSLFEKLKTYFYKQQ